MKAKQTILLLASTATLSLALHQGVLAEEPTNNAAPPASVQAAQAQAETAVPAASEATSAAQEAPATPTAPVAPAATPPATETQPQQAIVEQPPETAPAQPAATTQPSPSPSSPSTMAEGREPIEQRREERMQERKRRYVELRARAAEVGLELPETPPWEQSGLQSPEMGMPSAPGEYRGAMTAEERDARRVQRYQMMRERAQQRGVEMPETPPWKQINDEERQAHWEKMRNMTPQERQAMRDQHWQDMRERAQEKGIEMPETPPWRQAEQRRAEMKARWDSYRETLEAMTPEQKEAVQAIYGAGRSRLSPSAMCRQSLPGLPVQPPFGQGNPGFAPGARQPGFGYGQGQPMYPGPTQGWYGPDKGSLQGPPPPYPSGLNQRQ